MVRLRMQVVGCLALFSLFSMAVYADQVDDLIANLKDNDPFVRADAAEQLGQLKDKRAVAPLIELLQNPGNFPDAPSAAKPTPGPGDSKPGSALSKVEKAKRACAGGDKYTPPTKNSMDAAVLKEHLATLKGGSFPEQKKALAALSAARDKRVVSTLLKMLDDRRNRMIQKDIINTLGEIGDPTAYDILLDGMFEDRFARSDYAVALAKLGDQRAAQDLYDLVMEDNFAVDDVCKGLLELGGYNAVFYLNKLSKHEDVFVKREAAEALDSLDEDALQPLTELLSDSEPQVKQQAAEALDAVKGALSPKRSTGRPSDLSSGRHRRSGRSGGTPLSQQREEKAAAPEVNDKAMEVMVQIAAVEALGNIRDPRVVRPMLEQLQAPGNHEDVKRAIGDFLGKLNSKSMLRPFRMDLQGRDRDRQKMALESLGYIGNDAAIQMLIRAADDRMIGDDAIRAMGLTQNPKVLPFIEDALADTFSQSEAIDALQKFEKSPEIFELLSNAPDVQSPTDKKKVIEMLGDYGPQAIPLLADHMDNFCTDEVVETLVKINDPSAAPILVQALERSHGRTQDRIFSALKEFKDPTVIPELVDVVKKSFWVRKNGMGVIAQLATAEHASKISELLSIKDTQQETITVLDRLGWQPETMDEKVRYYVAKGEWQKCRELGQAVVPPLLAEFKKSCDLEVAEVLIDLGSRDVKDIMLGRLENWSLNKKQVNFLQTKLSWKPVTLEDKVAVAASAGDLKQLKSLWKDTKVQSIFREKLNAENLSLVDRVIRHSVHMGLKEMVSPISSRVGRMKDSGMAKYISEWLLNCGNSTLENAAKNWGTKHGYQIETGMGIHTGSPWGSG